MQMVMSMFRSPPKDAFLSAALREERKDELKTPAIFRGRFASPAVCNDFKLPAEKMIRKL